MTGAAARTQRPVDARRVERILRRLEALWKSRALADIQVVPNARLTRTLGRLVGRPWRIELGPRALVHARVLRRRSLLGESRVDEMLGRHGAALPFRGASSNSAEVRLEVVE